MDLKKIKELIDLFAATGLGELDFSEGDCRLRLVRTSPPEPGRSSSPGVAERVEPAQDGGGSAVTPVTVAANGAAGGQTGAQEVVAPLHGVLHLTPSPAEPPFVKPGDRVRVGQTLGVLEAMKMFHTLQSDHEGIVAAILAASGSEVEAGQPLFRITPGA